MSSDVTLVMDGKGIIQDMAIQPTDLSVELEGYGRWYGRPWGETVSAESRPKVETILNEAAKNTTAAPRQLTHNAIDGREVAILYSAIKIGSGDRVVALGRDMRATAALQQRLIDAQISMERDYAKLRFAEGRHRLLFQTTAEPVLILDAATAKVVEANPAAIALLDGKNRRLVGRAFSDFVEGSGRNGAQQMLADLRAGARVDIAQLALAEAGLVNASATLFRQDGASLVLLRLLRPNLAAAEPAPEGDLTQYLQASPDAFVAVDANGRILLANAAFAEMAQVRDIGALTGADLETWFGRPGDLPLVMMNLRQHGVLRLFDTHVRGAQGGETAVEVSAAAIGSGKAARFAFAIRNVGRRLPSPARANGGLPHSADQLTELIGRVPLRDLVRETTDVIEKLCIETALQLTGDNRASAAELLGLSRQSLYVKLRRFGIAADLEEAE